MCAKEKTLKLLSNKKFPPIPSASPRIGWAKAFKAMAEAGDDKLLDPEVVTEFDDNDWAW